MSFSQQLSTIFENAGGLRPALIVTARGATIQADHARWIKSQSGNIYLAVGLGPGGQEYVRYGRCGRGPMHEMRDFYAPVRHTPVGGKKVNEWKGDGWIEPYPDGTYDAKTLPIIRPKFKKILTIHKENVKSLKWL